ncbi:MAG TPA: hypothetical protein VLM79_00510 [Kofleriaceae bacterium]|nr:hypothetical protein [Kofleriaceae bacterium]
MEIARATWSRVLRISSPARVLPGVSQSSHQERAMRNIGFSGQTSVSRCWQIMSGVALALSLAACTAPSDTKDVSIETDQDGAVLRVSDPSGVLAPPMTDEKAGCTHIRFCNLNGDIVCDTNDKPCSNDARWNECFSDARFVCGRTAPDTRPMDFDPGIPCPITGIC